MYSGSFAVSLVGLTMISATLILAVTSNVILSLGMVGALSIVRFRTAIKDPLEVVFLFWAIETGIVLATGIYTLAVAVNIVIGMTLLVLVVRKPEFPFILVLKCHESALKEVKEVLDSKTNFTVKSRKAETQSRAFEGSAERATQNAQEVPKQTPTQNTPDAMLELDIEVTLKRESRKYRTAGFDETAFVDKLAAIPGVSKAILVTYNGGYMN